MFTEVAAEVMGRGSVPLYSDTSANEDNSFRNHIC